MQEQEIFSEQARDRIRDCSKIPGENPPSGWINAIRKALGLSLRQLGEIAGKTPQGIRDIELREKTGNITIAALERMGRHLDMKLIYGFVPLEGSFDHTKDKPATSVLKKSVKEKTTDRELTRNIPDMNWEED